MTKNGKSRFLHTNMPIVVKWEEAKIKMMMVIWLVHWADQFVSYPNYSIPCTPCYRIIYFECNHRDKIFFFLKKEILLSYIGIVWRVKMCEIGFWCEKPRRTLSSPINVRFHSMTPLLSVIYYYCCCCCLLASFFLTKIIWLIATVIADEKQER